MKTYWLHCQTADHRTVSRLTPVPGPNNKSTKAIMPVAGRVHTQKVHVIGRQGGHKAVAGPSQEVCSAPLRATTPQDVKPVHTTNVSDKDGNDENNLSRATPNVYKAVLNSQKGVKGLMSFDSQNTEVSEASDKVGRNSLPLIDTP